MKIDYIKEAERQLGSKKLYKMLDFDPTETHKKLVYKTTDRFKTDNTLKEKIVEGLKMANAGTPKIYNTPQIYKAANLGRHLIPTSEISEFVDSYLQRTLTENPSYVRETKDFLNKIKTINHVPEQKDLVTMDMLNPFTPTFLTWKLFQQQREPWTKFPAKPLQQTLLKLFCVNTNTEQFRFNVNIFFLTFLTRKELQQQRALSPGKGCAMGYICALADANTLCWIYTSIY